MTARRHTWLPAWAAAGLVMAASGPAGSAQPVVLEPATATARSASVEADAARAAGLARSGDPAAAVAVARATLARPGLDPAAAERLRHETLIALAGTPPDADARAFVEESKTLPPTVFLRLDESGHEIVVPAWDAPAAARFAERRWVERAAGEATVRVVDGHGDVAGLWLAAEETARPGILGALETMPAERLAAAAGQLSLALAAGRDVAPPALAVAARSRDAELFRQALRVAPAPAAVRALRDDLDAFEATDRVSLLRAALDRDVLASAALLRLAREAAGDPRAEALLWEALGHPEHGASAAAALARLPGARSRLEFLAAEAPDPVTARWARLALGLAGQSAEGAIR